MKKLAFFIAFFALALGGLSVQAQNCSAILAPFFQLSNIDSNDYVPEKKAYRCSYSHNAFYVTNEVPRDAMVFQFSELNDLLTGQKASNDIIIDLETFSFYQYNFNDFKARDFYRTIYFETPHSIYRYLAVRSEIRTVELAREECNM